MACTIDHLRVDHRVTVLRDFTDLAGTTLRAGETGVLLGLEADFVRMEIGIELERSGKPVKLRFALRAPDGPRVGRMKDYFELGEPVEAPPMPRPPPETPPAAAPRPRLPQPRHDEVGQVPDNTSLGERRVACDCDSAFHRDLLPANGSLSVAACLGCGTVTCSRSFGDDGRFTGNAWQEVRVVALAEPVHRWIAGWPRVKMDHTSGARWPMSADFVRYPTLYYPADTRCTDLEQLAALEARLAREQAGQTAAARLRATHRIRQEPPVGIPEDLVGYRMVWEALQLRPEDNLSDLLHLAQPRSPGKDLAAEVLGRRPDAWELVITSLRSPDQTTRGVGFVIARDLRPVDPRLPGVLVELLLGLPFEPRPDVPRGIVSRGRFEMILLLIAELELATPEVIATLRTLMRKFARHDDFLADCARIVLRELTAALPARTGTE